MRNTEPLGGFVTCGSRQAYNLSPGFQPLDDTVRGEGFATTGAARQNQYRRHRRSRYCGTLPLRQLLACPPPRPPLVTL
jgi:hypothetical protein